MTYIKSIKSSTDLVLAVPPSTGKLPPNTVVIELNSKDPKLTAKYVREYIEKELGDVFDLKNGFLIVGEKEIVATLKTKVNTEALCNKLEILLSMPMSEVKLATGRAV